MPTELRRAPRPARGVIPGTMACHLAAIALLLAVPASAGAPPTASDMPALSAEAARRLIADGNRTWGRARVALDVATFERMLAPDFYAQFQDRRLTRQQFIDRISAADPKLRLVRFDATVLTVQPTPDGWVAVIHERLEREGRTPGGAGPKTYALWITRDRWLWTGGEWKIASTEAIGSEVWDGGATPPFGDWSRASTCEPPGAEP